MSTCAACKKEITGFRIKHHTSYNPEKFVFVHFECHMEIHFGKKYAHLRPRDHRELRQSFNGDHRLDYFRFIFNENDKDPERRMDDAQLNLQYINWCLSKDRLFKQFLRAFYSVRRHE